ncbi:MAG: hypothetical protein OXC91_02060, partial [Rhodobacteraceae bacterium]|nr:hypothetical protein [Paracoccaceae bacterium]
GWEGEGASSPNRRREALRDRSRVRATKYMEAANDEREGFQKSVYHRSRVFAGAGNKNGGWMSH